jgi:diguanylate cyclase (GGDEF)-like protein
VTSASAAGPGDVPLHPADTIDQRVRRSLLDYTQRQMIPTAPAAAVAFVLFAVLTRKWADLGLLRVWTAAGVASCVLQYVVASWLGARPRPQRLAVTLLAACELAQGVVWAAAGVPFLATEDPVPWLLLVIFVLAVTGPSAVVMASHPVAHRLYAVPAIVGSVGTLVWRVDDLALLGLGGAVFLVMVVLYSNEAHRTVRKALEGQHRNEELLDLLGREARHDQLTGVLNRSALHEVAELARSRARAAKRGLGVLFVDLDRFKHVNDALGHAVGDDLLRAVAHRLSSLAAGHGMVARVGGDEFVIVLDALSGEQDGARFAEDVLDALSEHYELGDHDLAVGASIGFAWCPASDASTPTEELITHADVAMYRAKGSGGAKVVGFDGALMGWHQLRSTNEWQLRRAIADGELFYLAQRVVSGDGSVTGVELLARWRRPDGTNVPPNTFIPLAEESGLVVEIGRWILGEAVELLERWAGDPDLAHMKVAVNISGLHVRSTVVTDVAAALAGRRFDRARLTIEITETHLMSDLDASRQVLGALRNLGVNIALDDFGTGYSSLAYFAAIPADIIKADKSFVDDLVTDQSSRVIVQAIAALSVTFDRTLVVEGIETFEQWRIAMNLGGTLFQGYLFGRPEPVDALEAAVKGQRVAAPLR